MAGRFPSPGQARGTEVPQFRAVAAAVGLAFLGWHAALAVNRLEDGLWRDALWDVASLAALGWSVSLWAAGRAVPAEGVLGMGAIWCWRGLLWLLWGGKYLDVLDGLRLLAWGGYLLWWGRREPFGPRLAAWLERGRSGPKRRKAEAVGEGMSEQGRGAAERPGGE